MIQAEEVRSWLKGAMIEGMDTILNETDEAYVPVEVESQVADAWGFCAWSL